VDHHDLFIWNNATILTPSLYLILLALPYVSCFSNESFFLVMMKHKAIFHAIMTE